MNFKGKKIAILGWGMNGLDVYKYLSEKGAIISIYDRKEEGDLDFHEVDIKNIKLYLGKNYLKLGLADYDYVFRAPGVYRYLPEIVKAEKSGVIVTSVTKLFFDLCDAKTIGVTGTKGKGTTSTLIYQILKKDGKDAYLAGNIGIPMLEILPRLKPESWVILELSSFQLIDLQKSLNIAVVLNITTDHLDWHKDREEYIQAKTNIVRYQDKNDFAILSKDYSDSRKFSKLTKAKVYYFSKENKVKGSYVKNDKIYVENIGERNLIGEAKNLLLRGEHNWENVCAASCASFLAGASIDSIGETIFSFKGLEHRLELVGEVDQRKFYDDSFSTNPQTTFAAINSFHEPVTLILGGFDKGLNYGELGREITRKKNIENVVIIGDIADVIISSLVKFKYKGTVSKLGKKDMKNIVKFCFNATPSGGVVLLSPATSSFDMFKDYKDRGDQFKKAVKHLAETS